MTPATPTAPDTAEKAVENANDPTPEPVVEVVADFTADIFARYLENDEAMPRVVAEAAPFGQVHQTLGSATPAAATVGLVWTRPQAVIEPFARVLALDTVGRDELLTAVDHFADALLAYRRRRRALLVPAWTVPVWHRGWGMLDLSPGIGVRDTLTRMNLRLADRLAEVDGCYLLPTDGWWREAGARAEDPKAWFVTKVPFANAVFRAAVADVKAALSGLRGDARKLVIVDLDDTLWGGIVGDVGWQQLRLGGHDPVGEAFVAFQRALLALTRRGVQLAIVSKNEERVALEAIDRHPEMVLRRDHFAGWRINWQDKAQNVAALVRSLELGLDASVFLDDNPAERARVREALPDVLVPTWSRDPMRSAATVLGLSCFDQPVHSAEDRTRTAMYAAERARQASRAPETSLDEWLASLDLRITAAPLDDADLPRTAQLFNKTNQMNLATRRLSARELAAWHAEANQALWTVRVRDRFGDAGLTGILGLKHAADTVEVVDFVLSCRVMGRRVEETMLHLATHWGHARGASSLVARFRPTARNRPCHRFWAGHPAIRAEPTSAHRAAADEPTDTTFTWTGTAPLPLPAGVTLDLRDTRASTTR